MDVTSHSWGGRSLDRYVTEFEPDGEGGDAGSYDAAVADMDGGAEGGADSSADAAAGLEVTAAPVSDAEVPSPVEEAASPWAPSQDEWENTQESLQLLASLLSRQTDRQEPAAAGEETPFELDPLDPDAGQKIQQFVRQEIERGVRQQLADISPVVDSVRYEQATATKNEIIDRIDVDGFEKDKPEFREGAWLFASALIDEVKAELGVPADEPSARAAEIALRRGAERFTAFARGQREAGKQAYLEEMKALEGASGQTLGVSGGGIEGVEPTEDYDEALRRISVGNH